MYKKDDSSNILVMILSMPVVAVVFLVEISAVLAFIIVKNFFEICWMILKMPYESWPNRKTDVLRAKLFNGF